MNEVVERRVKCEMLADRKWIVAAMGAVAVAVGVHPAGVRRVLHAPHDNGRGGGSDLHGFDGHDLGRQFHWGEPAVTIAVTIPGLLKEDYFPSRYTCDGANICFPCDGAKCRPARPSWRCSWSNSIRPSTTHSTTGRWRAQPQLARGRGRPAPSGAVGGRNNFGQVGYSICPPRGSVEEHFVLRLLALPHRIAAKSGFDPGALFNEAEQSTKVVGLAGGVYTRR